MNIDVYIKSFNRAYFLDRCLYSLYTYLKGSFQIYVLDDGTPNVYLDKLRSKYPNTIFLSSPEAELKRTQISSSSIGEKELISKTIPLKFWRDTIASGSDKFLLWEDDIWLTETVDLNCYVDLMIDKNINEVKIRWWGNENTNVGSRIPLSQDIESVQPQVHWLAESMVKNRFYIHSICILLHLIKKTYFLQLYTYYEVAGVLFDKKYWLYLWPEDMERIEEMIQLGKAAEYARKHKNSLFAKTIKEKGRSTYLTSSAGIMNDKDGFSMSRVNYYLNEAWSAGSLNALDNFPFNFKIETLYSILENADDPLAEPEKWENWSLNFQKHFESIGCSPLG